MTRQPVRNLAIQSPASLWRVQFQALLTKELREAFRDRRALMAALLYAFFAPLMIYWLMETEISDAVSRPPVYLQVDNPHPALMAHLADDQILALDQAPPDKHALWQSRDIRLILASDMTARLARGEPVEVILRADFSDDALYSALSRVSASLGRFNQQRVSQRLLLRGIDLNLLQALDIQEQDTAMPDNNAGFLSVMLVMYLMMAAFFTSLSVAIDSSAGERERNVLELLLCQPVSTTQLVLAKLLTAALVALIGVVLTLAMSILAVDLADITRIGLNLALDWGTVGLLLAVLIPLCLFGAALQLLMAFGARSFKEAQSRVTLVIMVPALLPVAMMFITDKPLWLKWAPLSGQYLLLDGLFKGTTVDPSALWVTGLSTLLISVGLVALLTRTLRSEKAVLALG